MTTHSLTEIRKEEETRADPRLVNRGFIISEGGRIDTFTLNIGIEKTEQTL